jgi:hypothetical protein
MLDVKAFCEPSKRVYVGMLTLSVPQTPHCIQKLSRISEMIDVEFTKPLRRKLMYGNSNNNDSHLLFADNASL